jgi:hypothetical protein
MKAGHLTRATPAPPRLLVGWGAKPGGPKCLGHLPAGRQAVVPTPDARNNGAVGPK